MNRSWLVVSDRALFRSVLRLIFSCIEFVAREIDSAERSSSGYSRRDREKLRDTAHRLRVLGILAWIIDQSSLGQDQKAIRGGRSGNIREKPAKELLLTNDEEQAIKLKPMEMFVSDLLLFPPAAVDKEAHRARQAEASPSAFAWPTLNVLKLSPERLNARNRGVGGSDANTILSGDPERVLRLWQEKRGEAEPEDLSGRLSVVLGCWTEDFNRQWYEKLSGNRIIDAGAQFTCSEYRWRKCTLDGVVEGSGAVFEAKHTNSFVKAEEVLERYMPQLQHNMAAAKADRAVLSVIFGNAKYEMFEVAADWLYQLDLLNAEKAFWNAVLSGEPPVAVEAPPAPRPIATRELSFEGNNAWAAAAAEWLETSKAEKTHASACKSLKELLDDDVRRAFGHGIEAKRSKAGAVTIRELK